MKNFVTKYSVVYWVLIVALAIVPFICSDDAPWTWVLLALAVGMVVYYIKANIQG